MDKKERLLYVDVLKIIACFLVIVNHTNSVIFTSMSPSATWFLSVTYFFISKTAVPLFLMCSGVVLLGRIESYKQVYSRAARIVIVILLFSMLYWEDFSLSGLMNFFSIVYSKRVTTSYWYLYLYVGILLILPFLRKMTANFNHTDYKHFFFWILFFLGIMPIFAHYIPFLNYNSLVRTPMFSPYVGIFILGYYLNHIEHLKFNKTLLYIGFLALILIQVIATYFEYLADFTDYLFYDNVVLFTITASSTCLFCLSKSIFSQITLPEKVVKIISGLSKLTFGIYLLSDFLIANLMFLFEASPLHQLLTVVLFEILIFVAGLCITLVLRKLPILKHLL